MWLHGRHNGDVYIWMNMNLKGGISMKRVYKAALTSFAVFLLLSSTMGCSSKSEKEVQQEEKQEVAMEEKEKEMKNEPVSGNAIDTALSTQNSPKLKYLGHASIRIITKDNKVIYVDPFAGDDYGEPADIILVTHSHKDHTSVDKVKKKESSSIITYKEALKDGQYQIFDISGIKIQSVPAYNKNHPKDQCVGYVITFDGIKLYHAGDTSRINEMKELANMNITYALLPMDGVYNMGPEEAAECAKIINAKYNIPIHTGPNGVYSQENIDKFNVSNKVVLKPGDIIELKA